MTEHTPHNRQTADDEIDLRELFGIVWKGKWIIIAITFVFAVGSVFYALSLPNIYQAEAKLAPTEESQGRSQLGDMGGQLGGLSSLAGIQMGQSHVTPAILALEIMQSRAFITNFIHRRHIQAELMAAEEWNQYTGELSYNPSIYDVQTKTWVREVEPPKQPEPSDWEMVRVFREHLAVESDGPAGLVLIKIEHLSPRIAKQWVDWLIEDINNEMRRRDIEEAKSSLDYIGREMKNAQLATTQQIYSRLMEQQTQTIMLANVRPEYVYRVIDPAVVPEERARPSRAFIAIIGTFLGGFLSLFVVLLIHLVRKKA